MSKSQRTARSMGVAAMLALSESVVAQSAPRPTTLPAPTSTHSVELTRVSTIRELSDGRVLVVDEGDNRLLVIDFRAGSARQLGRQGGGVGEYGLLRRMFALGADTTLVPDGGNGRWLLLTRDSIVAMLAGDVPVVRAIGPQPVGADSRGAVLTLMRRIVDNRPLLDSLMVLRAWRNRGGLDTVGLVLVRPPSIPGGGRIIDPTKPVAIVFNPLAASEQVVAFPDGWVATARLAPYRVEWLAPDGQRTVGARLPFDAVKVDERERVEALARESRITGRPPRDVNAVGEWPSIVPAFLERSILPASDGTVWIRRAITRGALHVAYDVVDRRGALIRQVVIDERERIVGFGRGTVYSISVNADGIEQLRRHALPGGGVSRLH